METPKTEKRTHSDVESDSSPENQVEKRREMAATGVTQSSASIQEQFNTLSTLPDRLVSIERLVSGMSSKLAKLDSIERITTDTQTTIEHLTNSIEQVRTLAQAATQEVTRCERVIHELTTKTRQIDILKERMIQAESYSRRDNLLFEGIKETQGENCEQKILDIIVKDLKISDAHQKIRFTRVHRLGGRNPNNVNKARPIIAKFHFFKDRQLVWDSRRKLKGTNVWLSEDFPVEIRNRRQVLYPVFQSAMKMDNLNASLVADKLFINRQMYTTETLHRLPEGLRLENTSLRIEKDICFFYNRASPLSNFFPAPVTIDGISYKCSEQYYQFRKAETLGDEGAAMKILTADDPVTYKRLGDQATRTKESAQRWDAEKLSVMEKVNIEKFSQNGHLRTVLLSTGQMTLAEASPKDTFWGIGIPMSDKRKVKQQQWPGENNLGKILMKVRHLLKERL